MPPSTITSISPGTWVVGHSYKVLVTGVFSGNASSAIYPGCDYSEAWVINGDGSSDPYVTISNYDEPSAFISSTQMMFDVTVKDGAPSGTYDFSMTCDGNCPVATAPVQIKGCADETITSVSPNIWFAGKAYKTTITGTNFITKEKATKLCPVSKVDATATSSNVSVSDVTVVSDTQITATIKPDADSTVEPGTVTVDSVSSNTQIIDNEIQWNNQGNNQIITGVYSTGTQQVVVGQQILLTSNPNLPANITVTDSTWTVGGTRIGGYTVNPTSAIVKELKDDDLKNKPTITFYWVYPTDSPVTLNYCVTIPGLSADDIASKLNCGLPAKATFNVTGPGDAQMNTDPYGSVDIVWLIVKPCLPIDVYPYLEYGHSTGYVEDECPKMGGEIGTAGVKFTPPDASSTGGTYSFVQIVNNDDQQYKEGAKGTFHYLFTAGLDKFYPYPQNDDGTTSDTPDMGLDAYYTKVSRTFAATMYLLWTSSIQGSIPVPIGYQSWHFKASATNAGYPTRQNWTNPPVTTYAGIDGDLVPSAPGQQYKGYPTWTVRATLRSPTANATANATEEQQEEEQ